MTISLPHREILIGECEFLLRTLRARVQDLAYDPMDSSVSPCLGHLRRTPAEAVVNNIYH